MINNQKGWLVVPVIFSVIFGMIGASALWHLPARSLIKTSLTEKCVEATGKSREACKLEVSEIPHAQRVIFARAEVDYPKDRQPVVTEYNFTHR